MNIQQTLSSLPLNKEDKYNLIKTLADMQNQLKELNPEEIRSYVNESIRISVTNVLNTPV